MSQTTVTKTPNSTSTVAFPLGSDVSSLNRISLMRRLTDEMDRMFAPMMGRLRGEADFWVPSVEVTEHGGLLKICAELPGLRKEDVKVEVVKDALILQGERKRPHAEKHDGYYQSERSYGRFCRTIPLPEGANIDKAVAELVNGTLEVSIPIPETQASHRQIPVQEGKSRIAPPS